MTNETIRLEIEGMSCEGCVRRVEKLLERAGALEVDNVTIGSAEITVDPQRAGAQAIVSALEKAGYQVKANA